MRTCRKTGGRGGGSCSSQGAQGCLPPALGYIRVSHTTSPNVAIGNCNALET